ncbi:MAG: hypothetical protein ACLR2E_07435 [Lachnospiraceae bacterium]
MTKKDGESCIQLIKRDGKAKRGRFTTVHGVIETPVFMNVGTAAAIKGAVSTDRFTGDRYPGGALQHLSSSCAARRRGCEEDGRSS